MNQIDTLYARWLSGELTDQEILEMKSDGSWEALQAVIDTVGQLELPEYNQLEAYSKLTKRNTKSTFSLYKSISTIAAVAIVFLAAYGFFNFQTGYIEANLGKQKSFVAKDGSEFLLNDGSSLSYKYIPFVGRKIKLEGEAFFNVTKGNQFTVETQNGTVKVLGTSFNVRAWSDQFEVNCYTGRVAVMKGNFRQELTKNEGLIIDKDNRVKSLKFTEMTPSWRSGEISFINERTSEVFKSLERQFDISVKSNVENQMFTGAFQDKNLEQALLQVCKPLGYVYTISPDGKQVVISSK